MKYFDLLNLVTLIRIFLSMVVQYEMYSKQMDVNTPFLHDELHENIYIKKPKYFIQKGKRKYCILVRIIFV